MHAILSKIIKLAENKQIVTIDEVTHFSIQSHKFQFALLKKLHKIGFNAFSTEILTPVDAMIMNLWIEGKLDIELDVLYSDVLLTGGLGTYNWLEYFRGKEFKIVGLEKDQGFYWKPQLYKILSTLLSADFYLSINNYDQLHQFIQNEYDAIVYKQLSERHADRMTIWKNNIINELKSNNRLFIVGYHLNKKELGKSLIRYNLLCLGMGSANKHVFALDINNYPDKSDYILRGVLDYDKFYNMHQNINTNWRQSTVRMEKYVKLTPLESKNKKYNLVKPSIVGTINHFGYQPLPICDDVQINISKNSTNIYDYIVFIPKSTVVPYMYK